MQQSDLSLLNTVFIHDNPVLSETLDEKEPTLWEWFVHVAANDARCRCWCFGFLVLERIGTVFLAPAVRAALHDELPPVFVSVPDNTLLSRQHALRPQPKEVGVIRFVGTAKCCRQTCQRHRYSCLIPVFLLIPPQ